MLTKLIIKQIALIDYAEIDFTKGFNILSGETGSGKSIILDSLNFVLGAKADKNLIRTGSTECMAIAEFMLENDALKQVFDELDLDYDTTLIISRKLNSDGKNTIKINGMPATVSMVKKFTKKLIDIHGQSEHFSLLDKNNQLKLIDDFGGKEISDIKKKIAEYYSEYSEIKKNLLSLGGDENQRLIKLDVLNFQINEIQKSDISENEEEELKSIKEKLLNQEKISDSLSQAKNSFENECGINDIFLNTIKQLGYISKFSNDYQEVYDKAQNIYEEISDLNSQISSLFDNLDCSEYDLDQVESKLNIYKLLHKKYGENYKDIILFLENALSEKEKLENFNELYKDYLYKKTVLEQQLYNLYIDLHQLRQKYSKIFSNNVLNELKELKMSNSNFDIYFNEIPDINNCNFGLNGLDDITFMFSANLGEPLKDLTSVISGGEISRFLLAIKSQSAKFNDISTFIFDEIDAGISGETAKVVARKLYNISKNVQVIAVSHLPQICSFGDSNLLISKSEIDNTTLTNIKKLEKEDLIYEIIRLIGGNKDDSNAKELALSLLDSAKKYKLNN